MIEVGNFYHILVLIFLFLLSAFLFFILRKKSKEFIFKFLLIWCFCNFALHFLKQLHYMSFYSLKKSTAENICAVSTIIFPFIMLYKKQGAIHDFMFMIGVIGGFAGIVFPTEAIKQPLFCFESLRFFFCHYSLFAIPVFLAVFNIYTPKLKGFWLMPLFFLIYQLIICGNTALLIVTGLHKNDDNLSFLQLFFDRNILNNSFTFGPTDDMGKVGQLIGMLCPNFLKIDIFNIFNGQTVYWPVVWLTVPSFVIFVPLYFLITLPFTIKNKRYKTESCKQT